MNDLAALHNTVFVGQGVGCAGTTMTDTLKSVPTEKLLEFPVAEDLQMGFCIGLALQGLLPVCIYPRWNFTLLAANQLVNHLDRLPVMGYSPRVIIRTQVPTVHPFNPGPQHDDDFTDVFKKMLRTVVVSELRNVEDVRAGYAAALVRAGSTLLVEYADQYGAIPSGVAMSEQCPP
jgi:pyruvate/2-oxoglutarate/acetoin dehydrogenase E1 component